MKIEIFQPQAIWELGQRANLEDSIAPRCGTATVNDRLFIVCDGMGGHEKGEVASQTVCQALSLWIQKNLPYGEAFSDELFNEALAYAYEQLDLQDDGAAKKMGTTLTLIYIGCNGVTMAHIGDSRIYHIRPGVGILYQSRDHSLVYDLYQAGEISYEEMSTSPQKNIITRAMQPGEDNRVRADIVHTTDILPGDYYYLCTDGMLENMSNDELTSILLRDENDEQKCRMLVDATRENGDNHSAYLIKIKKVEMEAGDSALFNDESTSRFNALNIHVPKFTSVYPPIKDEVIQESLDSDDDDVSIVDPTGVQPIPKPVAVPNNPPAPKRERIVIPPRRKLFRLLFAILLLAVLLLSIWKACMPENNATKDSTMTMPLHSPTHQIQEDEPRNPQIIIHQTTEKNTPSTKTI